jgi:hypothetical protein
MTTLDCLPYSLIERIFSESEQPPDVIVVVMFEKMQKAIWSAGVQFMLPRGGRRADPLSATHEDVAAALKRLRDKKALLKSKIATAEATVALHDVPRMVRALDNNKITVAEVQVSFKKGATDGTLPDGFKGAAFEAIMALGKDDGAMLAVTLEYYAAL